jgi:hypothetical protein
MDGARIQTWFDRPREMSGSDHPTVGRLFRSILPPLPKGRLEAEPVPRFEEEPALV